MQLLVCDLDTSLFLMPQHEFLWCCLSKHCCSFRYPCLVSLQYFKNAYTEMHSLQDFFFSSVMHLKHCQLHNFSFIFPFTYYICLAVNISYMFGVLYFYDVADYKVNNNKIDLPRVTSCQHFIPLAWESELKYSLIALHLPWIPQRKSCIFNLFFPIQVL